MTNSTLYMILLFLVVLPQSLFTGVYFATAVLLGIDQINGGSNANISAFCHWLFWAYISGQTISETIGSVFYYAPSEINMIMSLLPVLLLSVGLILDFHFHHKLVKEPVTVNPVSLISKS